MNLKKQSLIEPGMNEATKTFIGDVTEAIHDATFVGGRRTQALLREIRDAVSDRNVAHLSRANPADVELTDEQWETLARKTRVLAAGPAEQW